MKVRLPGFTLIELLIVISVIGVLTSVLIIAINPVKQIQRARDTRRKSDVAQIQQALELYRADNGSYPSSPLNCGSALTAVVNGNTVTYLQKIPCDPKGGSYYYVRETNPVYCMRACLENSGDLQKDPTLNPSVNGCTTLSSCSTTASYTVQNP